MRLSTRKGWLLFLAVPLMFFLLALDSRMAVSAVMHQFVQLGIAAVAFGFLAVCVRWISGPEKVRPEYAIREHYVFSPPDLSEPTQARDEPVLAIPRMWLDLASVDKGKYN